MKPRRILFLRHVTAQNRLALSIDVVAVVDDKTFVVVGVGREILVVNEDGGAVAGEATTSGG